MSYQTAPNLRGISKSAPAILLASLIIALWGCGGGSQTSQPQASQPQAVKTLTSLSITPANPVVTLGDTQQLTVTGNFSDGTTQNMTSTVTWNVSPSTVATVNSTGMAKTQAAGTATLTATSGTVNGTDKLTVSAAALVSIAIAPSNPTVPKGETQQLTATGTFSDSSTRNITGSVAWSASTSGVATVSGAGLLNAQAMGTATITAVSGSINAADTVNVSAPVVVSIAVTPLNPAIGTGYTQQFDAVGTFSDGSIADITSTAAWSTAVPTVATINASALATAVALGTTAVSASSGSIAGSANLTVETVAGLNYFTNASTPGVSSATLNVTNPNATGTSLCAMFYVFDTNEEMNECCGCSVSPDDLRTLLIDTDLTGNPLAGATLTRGLIELVPADITSNPTCNPTAITPLGQLAAWSTHVQIAAPGSYVQTETTFNPALLNSATQSSLQTTCSFVQSLGSGGGVCSCGTGD
jgi:hypothetical protein